MVRQLVLQNSVFAIFNGLGTPTHLAVVDFLNAQKVPDVFVASGCECWNQPQKYPWTFGWQLDYVREGKILGQYVAQHFKGKKVGYFYQDDEFGQDGIKGLGYEIPASMVVSKQTYQPTNTNVGPQVAALKAAGAQVVVSFSIPAFTALLKLTPSSLATTRHSSSATSVPTRSRWAGCSRRSLSKAGRPCRATRSPLGSSPTATCPRSVTRRTAGSRCSRRCTTHTTRRRRLTSTCDTAGRRLHVRAGDVQGGQEPHQVKPGRGDKAGLPQGPVSSPFAFSTSDHSGATGGYIGVINNGVIVAQGPVVTTDTTQPAR